MGIIRNSHHTKGTRNSKKEDGKIKFQNYFLFIILLFETKTTDDNDLIEKQTNIKIYVQLTTILFLIIPTGTYLPRLPIIAIYLIVGTKTSYLMNCGYRNCDLGKTIGRNPRTIMNEQV